MLVLAEVTANACDNEKHSVVKSDSNLTNTARNSGKRCEMYVSIIH